MKSPKHFLVFVFLVLLVISTPTNVLASNQSISLDGKMVRLEYPLINKDGRNLIAIKDISQHLNLNSKLKAENLILLEKGAKKVELTLNNRIALLWETDENSTLETQITLAVAPQVFDNLVYVPLRFIAESFGAEVKWDPQARTILISTAKGSEAAMAEYTLLQKKDIQNLEELKLWFEANYREKGIYSLEVEEDTYILVSAGMKPTGGYSIKIDRAFLPTPSSLYIIAEVLRPNPTDMVTMALTYPSVILKFPRQTFTEIDGTLLN